MTEPTAPRQYVAPATLDDYMRRVDRLVTMALGLSIYDLDDRCYADWYEDGERPAVTAARIIRSFNNGSFYDDCD